MESHLLKRVIRYLKNLQVKGESIFFFKTHGEPIGIPDILICLNGKFIGIELKTHTGRISKAQEYIKSKIESAGGKVFIVRSVDELKKIIEKEKCSCVSDTIKYRKVSSESI